MVFGSLFKMPETFVDRSTDLNALESSVKNKFRWSWLEAKDCNGDFLSDYVRKIPEPGICFCLACNTRLHYGARGRAFITRHATSAGHILKRRLFQCNQALPSMIAAAKSRESGCSLAISGPVLPYGAAPNVPEALRNCGAPPIAIPAPPPPPPSFKDRISHQEAIICSFITEHSLPLSIAPHLIGLAQLLAKDHKALQTLSMERQTATYKLKHGLKELQRKRLVKKMQDNYFSMNIDESTTKHGKKRVLNILVCFFDDDLDKSVTHLYSSVEMFTVNAETVYCTVHDSLINDNIPLLNLISVLSDSAAYMRGKHNGFYVKLKNEAPHLIDIDADVCHHIHNISKLFMSSIDSENHVSSLLDDISKDFESADIRLEFSNLCNFLKVKFVLPMERASHRWLNVFDCCQRLSELKDVLTILYFSWLSQKDKNLYQDNVLDIFKEKCVSSAVRQEIFDIMKKLKSKNVTPMGRARKVRICVKMFDFGNKTNVMIATVLSVFPLFKKFVLLFEQKTPMVHLLHDNQIRIFKEFLQYYVKPEFLRESWRGLVNLDLTTNDIFLPFKYIYVGNCSQLFKKMRNTDIDLYRQTLLEAYKSTGLYMQKKLPLNNPLLRTLSLLDPKAFGQSSTAIVLRKLPQFFTSVHVDIDAFENEIMNMQSDTDISANDCALDVWWSNVFKLKRYPCVKKLVCACLSIFTGPRVEQSFSIMNNIITGTTCSLLISTYEAYMYNKYHLLAQNSTTLKFYQRSNPVSSPVDTSLAHHFQTASLRFSKAKKRLSPLPDPDSNEPPAKRSH